MLILLNCAYLVHTYSTLLYSRLLARSSAVLYLRDLAEDLVLTGLRTRFGGRNLPTLGTLARSLILHPLVDDWFQLCIEIRAVESDFFDED
jgi:hypothetical protein